MLFELIPYEALCEDFPFMTKSQYDKLTPPYVMDGKIYFCSPVDIMIPPMEETFVILPIGYKFKGIDMTPAKSSLKSNMMLQVHQLVDPDTSMLQIPTQCFYDGDWVVIGAHVGLSQEPLLIQRGEPIAYGNFIAYIDPSNFRELPKRNTDVKKKKKKKDSEEKEEKAVA